MGLAGNIRTFPFAEVVQTLNRITATGVLRLVAGEVSREVIFKNGQLIGVAFPLGQERQALLARLVMQGHLDAADAASMSSGSTASQVIEALVENKLVTDHEVNEAARLQAEEELYHIFTWPAADFSFIDANAPGEGERGTETYKKVDHHAISHLALNLNSVLMEAARRADEWTQVKDRLPDSTAVPGPVDGREAELKAAGAEFPTAAVVPLIDAIRSIDDIVAAAVVTRLDVYAELDSLATAGLITWLSRDDLIGHADWLAANQESSKAADLYRKALARDGRDAATGRKLAATLEQLGDAVEGAASWAQLAIAAFDGGDSANARDLAERAVSLAPTDVRWRTLLAKILASSGDAAGAVGEYILLAAQHTEAGRWEDARANALAVLAIRAGELRAVRVLARVAIATAGEPAADGTRPCPACGAKQDSDARVCSACRVSLQLPCRACNTSVSVHDAVCMMCAADPHAEASTMLAARQERGGVTQVAKSIVAAVSASAGIESRTSVAVLLPREGASASAGTSSGVVAWREQLDTALLRAQAIEESGNWEGALVAWRAVAALQPDNQALTAHTREIEDHLHESAIEAAIGRGHQGRRTRQYFKAVAAYRQALRLMGATDPRAHAVGESLRKAEKARTRLTALYGLAGVVILAIGGFAANPYIKSHRLQGDLAMVRSDVATLSDANSISTISTEIDGLTERAAQMPGAFGRRAKQDLDALTGDFFVVQNRLAEASVIAIRVDLAARNLARAEAKVDSYVATFRPDFQTPAFEQCRTRLTALKAELKFADDAAKVGPAKLEAAKKLEEDNRLAEALVAFRILATNPNPEVAPVAEEAVGRLEPRSTAFTAAWNSMIAAVAADLTRGERLDQLMADARLWGRETELKRLRDEVATRLATAEKNWQALDGKADPARIEAFIAAHPGAPQVEPAKTRLAALQNRLAHRDEVVASQRALLAASRWEQAWQAGQDLITGYAGLVDPATIELPLVIQSVPAGAKVLRDGKPLGTTPYTVRYKAGSTAAFVIEAAGWQPGTVVLPAAAAAWQTTVVLSRMTAWTVALGKPASSLIVGPGGQLNVVSREGLALIVAGQIRWRVPIAGDDLAAGDHAERAATLLEDGTMAVALPVSGVALIGPDGKPKGRITTTAEVRGRPLDYVNEVFGPQPRLAIAAETLRTGSLGGETLTIPLPSPAISGPISFLKDLDRVLVVADVEGRLTAIEESTRKTLWRLDLQASDCSHLKTLGVETVVAVLDGVRLSAYSVLPQAAVLWTVRLPGPAVGEPVIEGNVVHIAAGSAVLTVGADGAQRAPLSLPSPAATGLASDGKLSAVGCSDGTLVVMRAGAIAWTTPLGRLPVAVAMCAGQVVAALDDGTILAFTP